jgi:hypothetical protein
MMGAIMTPTTRRFLIRALMIATAAVTAAASPAYAANPVEHGKFMISAERLFGLSFTHETIATNNGDRSTNQTQFSLLYSSGATSVHMTPRLAFDFLPIDGLTLGGAVGVGTGKLDSSRTNNAGATVDTEGPTTTWFVISPRVGYALGLSQLAGLWLRGGVTYYYANSDFPGGNTSTRTTGLSFDLDPTLVLSPLEHLGFTLGFQINLPLTGSTTSETKVGGVTASTSVDHTIRNIGLVVGMVGVF